KARLTQQAVLPLVARLCSTDSGHCRGCGLDIGKYARCWGSSRRANAAVEVTPTAIQTVAQSGAHIGNMLAVAGLVFRRKISGYRRFCGRAFPAVYVRLIAHSMAQARWRGQ